MKFVYLTAVFVILLIPPLALASETMGNERVLATIEDSGNWQLTDNKVNVTWKGQWINKHLMKVTGSDNSCFILGENENGLVQLDCQDLREISILLSYSGE